VTGKATAAPCGHTLPTGRGTTSVPFFASGAVAGSQNARVGEQVTTLYPGPHTAKGGKSNGYDSLRYSVPIG